MNLRRTLAVVALAHLALVASVNAGELADAYPDVIDPSVAPRGLEWSVDAADVWRVERLSLKTPDGFALLVEGGLLVMGHHERLPVWAVVLADPPGTLVHRGEVTQEVASVWLRAHPNRLRGIATVQPLDDPGTAAKALATAQRIAAHKLGASFHVGNKVLVPPLDVCVVDAELAAGGRRFLAVNFAGGEAQHYTIFDRRWMPPDEAITPEIARAVFDEVWSAFDTEYASFSLRPDVDWDRLREVYRPAAETAETAGALAGILASLVAPLRDEHAWVKVGGVAVQGFVRPRPLNAGPNALDDLVGPLDQRRPQIAWARTADGFAYINVHGLTEATLPGSFDEILEMIRDTKGLILDLRFNGGGDERLGQQIAGRFLTEPVVYSGHRWRAGPTRTDLTGVHRRSCAARGPWRYEAPVVVLIGPRTFSSAESFALMLAAAPNVTMMGATTAGSSGNPRLLELPGGIEVAVPRWLDLLPDGTPLDGHGVVPMVPVVFPDGATGDPVLTAALTRLRESKP